MLRVVGRHSPFTSALMEQVTRAEGPIHVIASLMVLLMISRRPVIRVPMHEALLLLRLLLLLVPVDV